jgi:SP family xylose:H+ symportor-like MFS transporter
MIAAVLFLVSAIGSALPELGLGKIGAMGPAALTPFILYRILCGIGVGMASMLSPLYIAEIAPPAIRGRLISFNQMAIVLGIVAVYFVNWTIALQGDQGWLDRIGWRMMLGSEALPALLFLVLLFSVPDTPRWLVMRGRSEEALTVLDRLSPHEVAADTLRDIEKSLDHQTDKLFSFGVKVVLIGVGLSVFQQLVGINAVLYYAPLIFQNMGAANDSAFLQTVLVGSANVLLTLLAMATVDRWGRRPLLIWGGVIMAVAMIWLGAVLQNQALGPMALIAMIVYVAGFAMSWGPVVWVLLAEMFPNPIKGQALAIAVAAQWIANLLVSWSFKLLDGNSALNDVFHHGFSYYFYGAMSIAAAFFVYLFVPETRQQKLETIQAMWQKA